MTYHKSRICNFQEIGHDDKVSMPCVNDEGYVCNSVTSRCFERWVSHEFKDSPAIDILMQLTAPVIFLAQQFRACNWKLYRITSSSFLMQIRPMGKASSQFFRSPRRRPMFRRKSFSFATVMSAEKILCWKIQMWTFSLFTTAVAHRWCKHSDKLEEKARSAVHSSVESC